MGDIVWTLGARHAGSILGGVIGWGTIGALVLLVVGIGLCVLLARYRLLRVTFAGARFARGVTYAWIVVACLIGGGTLGALHGTSRGIADLIEDPAFVAGTLHPAAAPVTDGLIHAVALQAQLEAEPMLGGARPVPVPVLRAVLTDTSGAAILGGLRRVPALQASQGGRAGTILASVIGGHLAGDRVDGTCETLGLAAPMKSLAGALPEDPAATIMREALATAVEHHFVPVFVTSWLERGEHSLLWSVVLYLLAAIAVPIGLLWATEGIVRLARSRRKPAAETPASS